MTKKYSIKLLGLLFVTFLLGTLPALASESSTAIMLDQAVHFLTPEGNDVVVPPGTYELERQGDELRLQAQDGQTSISLQAQPTPFPDEVELPIGMAIPIPDEGVYLALAIPDHNGLEAMGSYSGIQTRGMSLHNLRKTFKPPFRKQVKSFAKSLTKKAPKSSLQKEWNKLVGQGKQPTQSKNQLPHSLNANALMVEVLRQSYLATQKDLQFYRAKIQDGNTKKQKIRQHLQDTQKKLAQERNQQRKTQWQQLTQRLKQELQTLENASKDLNFQLQTAMSKFSQAQQAMSQIMKKNSDAQRKIIENMK